MSVDTTSANDTGGNDALYVVIIVLISIIGILFIALVIYRYRLAQQKMKKGRTNVKNIYRDRSFNEKKSISLHNNSSINIKLNTNKITLSQLVRSNSQSGVRVETKENTGHTDFAKQIMHITQIKVERAKPQDYCKKPDIVFKNDFTNNNDDFKEICLKHSKEKTIEEDMFSSNDVKDSIILCNDDKDDNETVIAVQNNYMDNKSVNDKTNDLSNLSPTQTVITDRRV